MNWPVYTSLQKREIFHLEFLRWFSRKSAINSYCLKGGVNLRYFFKSIRYSEDMDIDIFNTRVDTVKKTVMNILSTNRFLDSLKSFGIENILPPDMTKAKQTETTQRFKVHLLTSTGEDLFTKIEFSRRGAEGTAIVESVSDQILRFYKMPPLLIPHYEVNSAITQKIYALAQRSVLQARDIFDLFLLSSQCTLKGAKTQIDKMVLKTAYENIFKVEFNQFRDTVVEYLEEEDKKIYSTPNIWDEIKLKTTDFLEEIKNGL